MKSGMQCSLQKKHKPHDHHHNPSKAMKPKKKVMRFIKIPKGFFDDLKVELKVPTFECSCGEIVLDVPYYRLQASLPTVTKRLTKKK